MSSPRLRAQFERLFEYFQGQDSTVQMEDIMEALVCTQRNVRMVLNKLVSEGWIEWKPAAGRGKQSQLYFKCNIQNVIDTSARNQIEQGKFDNALMVLNQDQARFNQLLRQYFGLNYEQGSAILRLPHYRGLKQFHPQKASTNAELQVVDWLFSGLTRYKKIPESQSSQTIQPDIAYQWKMISATHWRFFLRNNIKFHNGERLTTDIIIANLSALKSRYLFSHIEKVYSSGINIIDIELSQADHYLDKLLARTEAKINWVNAEESVNALQDPIGTGAYKVIHNKNSQLILQSNEQYFLERPLIDQIEISVVDPINSKTVYTAFIENNQQHSPVTQDSLVDLSSLASVYLFVNKNSNKWLTPDLLTILEANLTPLSIFKHLSDHQVNEMGLIPCYDLLPSFSQSNKIKPASSMTELTEKHQINLAYPDNHPLLTQLIPALKLALKSVNINLQTIKYEPSIENELFTVSDVVNDADNFNDINQADLILSTTTVLPQLNDTIANNLMLTQFLEQASFMDIKTYHDCLSHINQWRETTEQEFPIQLFIKSLMENKQVLPLFHHWQTRDINACGALYYAATDGVSWWSQNATLNHI